MDLEDLLNSLRELIVLLPVVILVFGPMLVRLLRPRTSAAPGDAAGAAQSRTRRRPGQAGKDLLRPSPPGRRPVALRISREQVIRRAGGVDDRPQPSAPEIQPAGEGRLGEGRLGEGRLGEGRLGEGRLGEGRLGEGRLGEGRLGEVYTGPSPLSSPLEERALIKEGGTETAQIRSSGAAHRRIAGLGTLKRAIIWAEILGKPKGW